MSQHQPNLEIGLVEAKLAKQEPQLSPSPHRLVKKNRPSYHFERVSDSVRYTPIRPNDPKWQRMEGNVSKVNLFHDQVTGRLIAFKRLKAHSKHDPILSKLPFQETIVHQKIGEHPHILSQNIIALANPRSDSGENNVYLGSEFFQGHDALTWAETTNPTLEEIAQVIDQIASALEHTHSHNYLHLDVKPQNVLVGYDQTGKIFAKLTDFETARHIGDTKPPERVVASPPYDPPEIRKADKNNIYDVDQRTDVFLLAQTAVALLNASSQTAEANQSTIEELQNLFSSQNALSAHKDQRPDSIQQFNRLFQAAIQPSSATVFT